MGFFGAVISCFSKYATFSGRASRAEFWYFFLFNVIAGMAVTTADKRILDTPSGEAGIIYISYILFAFLPNISVIVRRLHDIDKSGWWYWIILIPIFGILTLLFWWCKEGRGHNKYGPPVT